MQLLLYSCIYLFFNEIITIVVRLMLKKYGAEKKIILKEIFLGVGSLISDIHEVTCVRPLFFGPTLNREFWFYVLLGVLIPLRV